MTEQNNFVLQPAFDAEDNIPQASIRDLYVKDEQSGKFTINNQLLNGFKPQEEFAKVNSALQSERKERGNYEKQLKQLLNGKTMEEVNDILDQYHVQSQTSEQDPKTAPIPQDVEKLVSQKMLKADRQINELNEAIKRLTDENSGLKGERKDRTVSDIIRTSASRLNARPDAIDTIIKLARSEFDMDEEGNVKTRDGMFSPDEWITSLQDSNSFFFTSPQGSGALGSNARSGNAGVVIVSKEDAQDARKMGEYYAKGLTVKVR